MSKLITMIGLLGLNHKSSPLNVRQKFVFCEEDIKRFVPLLKCKGFEGVLVLSTCNWTEIYFESDDNDIDPSTQIQTLKDTLFHYRNVPASYDEYFYDKKLWNYRCSNCITCVTGSCSLFYTVGHQKIQKIIFHNIQKPITGK